jgi:hypothetical protein
MLSAAFLLLGWSELGVAEEPASFALAAKAYGFPVIDTTITFTRLAEHTYQVRYSNPPPSPRALIGSRYSPTRM